MDRNRLIIRGGSAGGFTTLAALSIAENVKVFAAATSLYGVSDLKKLAEFTHKFESRYLDHLIGGTPQEVPAVYYARSPINHAGNIVVPLLVSNFPLDLGVGHRGISVVVGSCNADLSMYLDFTGRD